MGLPDERFRVLLGEWVLEKRFQRERDAIRAEMEQVASAMQGVALGDFAGEVPPTQTVSPLRRTLLRLGRKGAGGRVPTFVTRRAWAVSLAAMLVLSLSSTLILLETDWVRLPGGYGSEGPIATAPDAWVGRGLADPDNEAIAPMLAHEFPQGWRRAALLVGVSRYADESIPTLPTASRDAQQAGDSVVRYLGASKDNVILLIDELATEAALRASLMYLREFTEPTDFLYVYVAAHAVPAIDGGLRFQLYDSGSLGGVTGREILETLGAVRGRVVLVADVCHSGRLIEASPLEGNQWVVASAEPDERAFEVPSEGRALFSQYWLRALAGEADTGVDGVVTLDEAFEWARDQLGAKSLVQHPMLSGPADPAEVLLSVHPDLQERWPARGVAVVAPVPLTLDVGLDYRPAPRLWLDGEEIGAINGPNVLLPVSAGEHVVRVGAQSSWGETVSAPSEWTATVDTRASEPLNLHVLLRPPALTHLRVIDAKRPALFDQLVRSPATDSVRAHWQPGGALKIEFSWETGSLAAPRVLSAAYISDPTQGVDVTGLLGVGESDTVLLSFDARAEQRDTPVIFSSGGRIGVDSLRSPVVSEVRLSSSKWKRLEMTLQAEHLHRLVTGLGVEVRADDVSAGYASILLRDVTLMPKRAGQVDGRSG